MFSNMKLFWPKFRMKGSSKGPAASSSSPNGGRLPWVNALWPQDSSHATFHALETQQMLDEKLVTWAINQTAILPHEALRKLTFELVWGTLTMDYLMTKRPSIALQAKLHFARMMQRKHAYSRLMQEPDRILVTFPGIGPDAAWETLFDQAAAPLVLADHEQGWLEWAFLELRPDDLCTLPLFADGLDTPTRKRRRSSSREAAPEA